MNRTQLACCLLLASAFVLGGLLISRISENQAHAETVSTGGFVFLTAVTQNGNQSLFVLDQQSHTLLVYDVDFRGRGGSLNFKNAIPIAEWMKRLKADSDKNADRN